MHMGPFWSFKNLPCLGRRSAGPPVALQPAPGTRPAPCVQCHPTPSVHQFPNRDPGPPYPSPVDPPSRGGWGLRGAGGGGGGASTWSRSLRSRSMSARESRSNDQAHRRRPLDGLREADPGCRSKLRDRDPEAATSRGGGMGGAVSLHHAGGGAGGGATTWTPEHSRLCGPAPASARALPSLAHEHRHPLHARWAPGRGEDTHTHGTPGWLAGTATVLVSRGQLGVLWHRPCPPSQ